MNVAMISQTQLRVAHLFPGGRLGAGLQLTASQSGSSGWGRVYKRSMRRWSRQTTNNIKATFDWQTSDPIKLSNIISRFLDEMVSNMALSLGHSGVFAFKTLSFIFKMWKPFLVLVFFYTVTLRVLSRSLADLQNELVFQQPCLGQMFGLATEKKWKCSPKFLQSVH